MKSKSVWAELLAKDIHEAQREAVAKGKTLTRALGSEPYPFIEWNDLPEKAREGRRLQAQYLLSRYNIPRRLAVIHMTPNEMVAMVRRLIADEQATGYTTGGNLEEPEGTQELLHYLDRAVDEYSKRQAAQEDMRLLKKMNVNNGSSLPDDYLKLCGTVPFDVDDSVITYYGDETKMPARYFARLPYVSSYGGTAKLPYKRDQEIAICALAAIYALNKHEFQISQDLMLLGYGASNGNAQ